MTLPQHLLPVLAVLQRAYPGNVPSVDYYPLLVVLQEDMSARNLAAVVAELVDGETAVVDNDAAAAVSVRRPPPRDVERVRTHLLSNGWIPEED